MVYVSLRLKHLFGAYNMASDKGTPWAPQNIGLPSGGHAGKVGKKIVTDSNIGGASRPPLTSLKKVPSIAPHKKIDLGHN